MTCSDPVIKLTSIQWKVSGLFFCFVAQGVFFSNRVQPGDSPQLKRPKMITAKETTPLVSLFFRPAMKKPLVLTGLYVGSTGWWVG